MNARERLLDKAAQYFDANEPIPVDLAFALMDEGVDVTELERKYA